MKLISFFVVLLCVMVCGCTRKIYVPVETEHVRTDTLRVAAFGRDSVEIRDSVALIVSGDTVRLTHYRDRVRLIERRDTVLRVKCDTLVRSVPYPVERKASISERMRLALFWPLAVVLIALIVWLLRRR